MVIPLVWFTICVTVLVTSLVTVFVTVMVTVLVTVLVVDGYVSDEDPIGEAELLALEDEPGVVLE